MSFKKINKSAEILLKLKDKEAYQNYKFLKRLQDVTPPPFTDQNISEVHFKHSGNIGDIIYAIPAMYALAKGRDIHLHLSLNQPGNYGKMKHPLGHVMLTEKIAAMIKPLLLAQLMFKTCDLFQNQSIDYDLDKFREYPFNYKFGSICRWYFLAFGIAADLSKPWLQITPDPFVSDAVVIARSFRYRQPGIDYSFLSKYPRLIFLGLKDEYENMKKSIPQLEHKPVENFADMAAIIAGSKLFIGNQSFPFALAEGLKVPRVLEVYHQSPNVIVEGDWGYDFCYQPQFEKIVAELFMKE